MSSIIRRRRGLNWAIGNSCLRDGLQHPHPFRQKTFTKSRRTRRGSGFVQSPPNPHQLAGEAFGIIRNGIGLKIPYRSEVSRGILSI